MRKDWRYPYRVVRPEDEFNWKDSGFLLGVVFGFLIFYPLTFILKTIEYQIKKEEKLQFQFCGFCFVFLSFSFYFLFFLIKEYFNKKIFRII